MPIDALSVLCAQMTRDLLATAKFVFTFAHTEREVRTAVYPHGYCALSVVVVVDDTTITAIANQPFSWTISNPNSDPNPNTDLNPKYNP